MPLSSELSKNQRTAMPDGAASWRALAQVVETVAEPGLLKHAPTGSREGAGPPWFAVGSGEHEPEAIGRRAGAVAQV
jgi:hypothetical protein